MTAPYLSAAERATVERFERAPDALVEVAVCQSCGDEATTTILLRGERLPVCLRHYNIWRTPPDAAALTAAVREWLPTLDPVAQSVIRAVLDAADTTALDRALAEAAYAREAEVRERVEAALAALTDEIEGNLADLRAKRVGSAEAYYTAGLSQARDDLRAALAPADNDGEAGR